MPTYATALVLCLLSVGFEATAQAVLRGQVNDGVTREGLAYATVYFDGTSVGDVTDETGAFAMALPEGFELPRELTASYVGYGSLSVEVASAERPIRFELAPAAEALRGVEVFGEDRRSENIGEYRRLLIGRGPRARFVELRGEDRLRFERERAGGADGVDVRFRATDTGPLDISLPHLGYALTFYLREFVAEYDAERYRYLAGTLFVDEAPERGLRRRRILRNRERAYYGSELHFLRALYASAARPGALGSEGFAVEEVERDSSGERAVVRRLKPDADLSLDSTGRLDLRRLVGKEFRVRYYGDSRGRPLGPLIRKRTVPVQSHLTVLGPGRIRADGTSARTDLHFVGDIGQRAIDTALPADYYSSRE